MKINLLLELVDYFGHKIKLDNSEKVATVRDVLLSSLLNFQEKGQADKLTSYKLGLRLAMSGEDEFTHEEVGFLLKRLEENTPAIIYGQIYDILTKDNVRIADRTDSRPN